MKYKNEAEEGKRYVISQIALGNLHPDYCNQEDMKEIVLDFIKKLERASGKELESFVVGSTLLNPRNSEKYMKKSGEDIKIVEDLIEKGFNNSQISRETGITRKTIARIREDMEYAK